jgi:hypothetical protein
MADDEEVHVAKRQKLEETTTEVPDNEEEPNEEEPGDDGRDGGGLIFAWKKALLCSTGSFYATMTTMYRLGGKQER